MKLFTARRYASAVFAVVMCPSVCPSFCHQPELYRNSWTNRAGFWHGCFLPPMPQEIRKITGIRKTKSATVGPRNRLDSPGTLQAKLRYFPSEFSPNSGLRKFRHDTSIALSTELVDAEACWRHLYDNRRIVAIRCNPLTPLLRFVVDLLYNLFQQVTRCFDWKRVAWSVCGRRASCSCYPTCTAQRATKRRGWLVLRSSYRKTKSATVGPRNRLDSPGTLQANKSIKSNRTLLRAVRPQPNNR